MDVPAKGNILGRFVPARYILAVLGSIGMAIVYGLKVNLSVAIVGMVNHTAAAGGNNSSDKTPHVDSGGCAPASNDTAEELNGPFLWSTEVQGIILSCYFWGYFISQIPGARVAELFSAKWVMFFSVSINVVCTLLTPVMAEAHYAAVVVMRIGEGIGGGVTFPAMHVLLSKWAPPSERSVMAALVYAGTSLGTVISMLMAGILTATVGWESVFYVMGGLSGLWCVLWVILVQDSPQQQPFISKKEREMIVISLGGKADDHSTHKKLPVPWAAVFKSPAFLAILVAHTCSNWGWYMLLIELPAYMKQILKFKMTENAVTTAMPFLSLWIFSMALSRTLDWLRGRGTITTSAARKIGTLFVPWAAVFKSPAFLAILVAHTCSNWGWYMLLIELPAYMKQILKFKMTENAVTTAMPFLSLWIFSMALSRTLDWLRGRGTITTSAARKIGTLFASAVPAACLLAICYIGCNRAAAVALMAVAVTCIGGMFCGFLTNHIDIAPNFAGTLMAMTNTVATIPGIVVPIFVGVLTHGNETISAWRIIFFVTIGLYIIEIIVYTLFGSGEEQPWNKVAEDTGDSVENKPLNNEEKTRV